MSIEEKTKELDASLKSIRSQSGEGFGIEIGSKLFDDLDQNGRLSNAPFPNIERPDGSLAPVKILDDEFYVYRINNDSCEFEIGPRAGALVHL